MSHDPEYGSVTQEAAKGGGAGAQSAELSKGRSALKGLAYASALTAAAAIGFAVGGGASFLFSNSGEALDPNSEVGLELGRLRGEINELRDDLANIELPDLEALGSAELQLQTFDQRLADLESGLKDEANLNVADARRFQELARSDGELSTRLEKQEKTAEIRNSEFASLTAKLEGLVLLGDDVAEIRRRLDELSNEADISPELSEILESYGQRLSDVEERSRSDSNTGAEDSGSSADFRILLANDTELAGRLNKLQSDTEGLMNVSAEIESIRSQLLDASADIETLASQVAERSEAEEILPNEQKLETLESEISKLRAETASALDGLGQELAALESEIRASLDAAAARIAYSRIFEAIYSGRPYSDFMEEVDWVRPEQRETLALFAESGVESLDDLQELFLSRARNALRSEQAEGESEPAVTSFLKSLVVVRPLNPQEGDDARSILSRAESALRDGRLRAALEIMEGLPENSRQQMKEWSDAANSRLAVLDALRVSVSDPSAESQE